MVVFRIDRNPSLWISSRKFNSLPSAGSEARHGEPAMKLRPVEIFMLIAIVFVLVMIILEAIIGP
jgi:hypothetical protein